MQTINSTYVIVRTQHHRYKSLPRVVFLSGYFQLNLLPQTFWL